MPINNKNHQWHITNVSLVNDSDILYINGTTFDWYAVTLLQYHNFNIHII